MRKYLPKVIFIALMTILLFDACKSGTRIKNITDELSVGEVFELRVTENQSTGYEMCWINKKEARYISLVKKEYEYIDRDCAGCAGTAIFTFKALARGKDTIQLVNCPTLREGKTCEQVSMEVGAKVQEFVADIK